jgi:HSP20 family protein
MNRLFSDTLARGSSEESTGTWAPPVDIYEDGENLVLKAELPGVRKEDLEVKVENNVLSLQGERRQEKDVKNEQFHRVERTYGTFVRSFTLPAGMVTDQVRAEFRDGVLPARASRGQGRNNPGPGARAGAARAAVGSRPLQRGRTR